MYNLNAILTTFLVASTAVTQTLPPSPTASVGCHPHDDHWHCDGPASSTALVTISSTHNNETLGTLAPSPTESIGCEPYGDYWHCDGPYVAETASSIQPIETAGVGKLGASSIAILGGLFAVAGMGFR
ncbi:hypothetical protein F4813DRAFT_373716 [Daldinia decipiens]|uniref:uncharacterized protein n=1 Tax=Daldinia decipiens TaxID=326647 RepID=UPI0020C597AD|nr:uncharacterized protein F4813DRAFT_373716 [Daldinia decipiens]KAI1653686.1 hypothetical protein F4813DRAFT_373716 [Daldinia decipiens]